MEKKFSLQRIGLLLQRYFLENLSREIMFWCIMIFLFTILDHRVFVIIVLFISGFAYTIRLQKEFFRGTKGANYLMIPATKAEKLISTVLLNTVYHFIMTLVSYALGNLLIILIYQLILKINVPVNWDLFIVTNTVLVDGVIQASVGNVFWILLGYYAVSQAIIMVGSLYFEKNAFLKTFLSLLSVIVFLSLIQIILFKSLWDVKYLSNAILPAIVMIKNASIPTFLNILLDYGCYLVLPFLWVVSYYRLSEKEI